MSNSCKRRLKTPRQCSPDTSASISKLKSVVRSSNQPPSFPNTPHPPTPCLCHSHVWEPRHVPPANFLVCYLFQKSSTRREIQPLPPHPMGPPSPSPATCPRPPAVYCASRVYLTMIASHEHPAVRASCCPTTQSVSAPGNYPRRPSLLLPPRPHHESKLKVLRTRAFYFMRK